MTVFKRWAGWTSWLIVAAWLYGFAWTILDPSFHLAFPEAAYLWLDDLIGTTTQEGSFDLAIWSTSMTVTLGLHALVWLIGSRMKSASSRRREIWFRWQGKLFTIVGWMSWLLVSTLTLLFLSDEIYEAWGGKLANDTGEQLIELIGGFLVVGSLHLGALKITRRR